MALSILYIFSLLLIFIDTNVKYTIYVVEIVSIFFLPYLIYYKLNNKTNFTELVFIALIILWFLSQLLTDIFVQSTLSDAARGQSKIVFFFINIICIHHILLKKKDYVWLIYISLSIGLFLKFLINPNIFAASHPWKFGIGQSVNLLLVVFSSFYLSKSKAISVTILLFAGCINFYFGFRSWGGIFFLTVLMLFILNLNRNSYFKFFIGIKYYAATASILLIYSIYYLIEILRPVNSGSSNDYVNNELGIILSGRPEILVSTKAIFDSPIIGHGSWAKNCYYSEILSEKLADYDLFYDPFYADCLIPTHSYIFGSWVEAGFLGGFFWLSILIYLARNLFNVNQLDFKLQILVIFLSLIVIWAIIFSPFGGIARFVTAIHIGTIFALSANFKNSKNN